MCVLVYITGAIIFTVGFVLNKDIEAILTGSVMALLSIIFGAYRIKDWEKEDLIDISIKETELAIKQEELRKTINKGKKNE